MKWKLAAKTLDLVDCAEAAKYVEQTLVEVCCSWDLLINCYVDINSLFDSYNSRKNVYDKMVQFHLAVLGEMIERSEIHSNNWVDTFP